MSRVDVALKIVSCNMHVAKYILYDVARKIDSFNIPRKVDAVLRKKSLLQVFPCKGRFRRRDFCLRLSYATFVACAACIRQRSYTTRLSNILIVATTVVRF